MTESSQFADPAKTEEKEERNLATPVVTDCCFQRRIWLIVVFATQKGILGPIGHAQYRKAFSERLGTRYTDGN